MTRKNSGINADSGRSACFCLVHGNVLLLTE
jgi:hypothetical protein